MLVFSSPLVGENHQWLDPVNAHLAAHQMVPAERETIDAPGMMFGKMRVDWYMTTTAMRDGLLAYGGRRPLAAP